MSLRNISLLCIALAAAVFSASPSPKGPLSPFFRHLPKSHGTASPHRGLAKTAAALVYAKTGSNHFVNAGTDNNPDWTLSSRDTIIYDAAGHEILSMSSTADSGWSTDGLSALDSTIYSNGKIVGTVSKSFNSYSGIVGYRSTIAYLNSDRVIITTAYDWDDLTQTWIPSYKDSAVFSVAAGTTDSGISNLTNLTALFSWNFDTMDNTWTSAIYYARRDGECTATTLVLTGKEQSGTSGSLIDTKITLSFSSSVWIEKNMTQQAVQQKDPATGDFVNVSIDTREVNASGYQLGYKHYDWDAMGSNWILTSKTLNFPDAHGNDTFDLSADYNTATSAWDTTGMDRYARTYDANGNNTEIIASSYSGYNGTWGLSEKTVNTYAQINMAVKGMARQTVIQNIVVKASPTVITFSGRNIEGVDLFNAAGRVVSSVTQRPSAELSLNLTGGAAPVPAGVYIAQLRTTSGKSPVRLVVCR